MIFVKILGSFLLKKSPEPLKTCVSYFVCINTFIFHVRKKYAMVFFNDFCGVHLYIHESEIEVAQTKTQFYTVKKKQ